MMLDINTITTTTQHDQHKCFIAVFVLPSVAKLQSLDLSVTGCWDHLDPAQAEPSVNGRGQSIPSDGTRPFVVHVQPLPRVDYRSQFGCRCRVEQIFEGNLLQRLPIETQGFTKTPKTDQFRLSRAEIPIRSRVSYFVEPCDG